MGINENPRATLLSSVCSAIILWVTPGFPIHDTIQEASIAFAVQYIANDQQFHTPGKRKSIPDSDINGRDKAAFIPLHAASRYRHVDVTRLLVDRGADVNAPTEDHWTALHLASCVGHLDIAKLPVDCGANVDTLTAGMASSRLRWPWHRTFHHDLDTSMSHGFFSIAAQM